MNLQGLICAECGKAAIRKSGSQKYCEECTAKVRAGYRKNRSREAAKRSEIRYSTYRNEHLQRRSLELNDEDRRHISTVFAPIEYQWLVRFKYPYSRAASKNAVYRPSNRGISVKEESRVFKHRLAAFVQSKVQGINIVKAKVWVDILVQKPTHQSDAINVIDLLCDAIKVGVGVDDKWFSIARVDWQVVKTEPMLIIGIGQEHDCHHEICVTCGRMLTADQFAPKLHGTKRHGSCLDCRQAPPPRKVARDKRTHCKRGHALAGDNIKSADDRRCLTCMSERGKANKAKKRVPLVTVTAAP